VGLSQLGRLSLGGLAAISLGGFAAPVSGQIIPDTTLGSEASIASPNRTVRGLPATLIEGGAIRGRNLFQSFREFNVSDGQRVYFANPVGIDSILSRVTGSNPSRIFGLLGVDGAANLFLMNPNGILFGANARLDIAGSFVATTADRLTFENGQTFSARNPEAPPLLTVTLRPNLPYGTNYQGNISHAGNLAVGTGQTLSLQGNTVTTQGNLTAPGGTVQVLGDRVTLLPGTAIDVSTVGGGGTVLVGGEFQGKGEVPNAWETFVAPGVTINADAIATGDGGRVIIWADNDTQFAGTISARGGATSGNGGFVEVSGKQTLSYNGFVDTAAPNGRTGTLLLDPFDFEVNAFNVDSINQAVANVILTADNNITFNAPISMANAGIGLTATAGNNIFVNQSIETNRGAIGLFAGNGLFLNGVTIDTNRTKAPGTVAGVLELRGGNQVSIVNSRLFSRSDSDGRAFSAIGIASPNGSVQIQNSFMSTTNFGSGFAGDTVITAAQDVAIANTEIFSRGNRGFVYVGASPYNGYTFSPNSITLRTTEIQVANSTEAPGAINSGSIFLTALGPIGISDGSRISSSTFRTGDAGTVVINAGASFSLTNNSRIFSNVERGGNGDAGLISVRVGDEVLLDNSLITSSTFGVGDAGLVGILAGATVSLNNGSSLLSAVGTTGVGDAGGILIEADNLLVNNNSSITTQSIGRGDAGIIVVDVNRLISVRNNSGIRSSVINDGLLQVAGDIRLRSRTLHVRDNSDISVDNFGIGLAGDISISALGVWLDNGSSIGAGTFIGFGGNIALNVPGALIIGRDSGVFASTLLSLPNFQGGGSIAVGSGQLRRFSAVERNIEFTGLEFDGRTLLVAGKTPRDNNILARGFEATGGVIRVNAFRLQNIAERPDTFATNDISTASFFQIDGLTVVNAVNIFPSFRIDPLPERTEVPKVAQGCDPRVRQETSQFTISGRGGLPPNAADGLNLATFADTPSTPTAGQPLPDADATAIAPPARGWQRNSDGTIQLIAQVTDPAGAIAPTPLRYSPPCYAP
jgi:filamentous hemagglutinin family protein